MRSLFAALSFASLIVASCPAVPALAGEPAEDLRFPARHFLDPFAGNPNAGVKKPWASAIAIGGTMIASFYDCFQPGECSRSKRTASGEPFNPHGMTAAHKTLPFGTRLRVTYGDRSVEVRINDRGPFIAGRDLDLALGAARAIGLTAIGVGRVLVRPL